MTPEEKAAAIMAKIGDARLEASDALVALPQEAVDAVAKWAAEWYLEATYKGIGKILVERGKMLIQK